ncbi:hypothetical protein [Algoriphagus formosus]
MKSSIADSSYPVMLLDIGENMRDSMWQLIIKLKSHEIEPA